MSAEASPARVKDNAGAAGERGAAALAAETTVAQEAESREDPVWRAVLDLPCEFVVDLPLPSFTIADLLKLRRGSVLNADWRVGQDIPLRVNGKLFGWGEFEVMGDNLAVRWTELA